MRKYPGQKHVLVAVDCIIFGFDGRDIKLLLVHRAIEPEKNSWSLMGGFLQSGETLEQAANRVLRLRTGLEGVYMEQIHTYSDPKRDPVERTISTAFFALIDIHRYEKQLGSDVHPEWFLLNEVPRLIFDHEDMLELAKKKLRYKAALHPILFELLPRRFTIPQLQHLFEEIFSTSFDNRNFSRKLLSTGLLVKLNEKDKSGSKKGAFLYKLNRKKYKANFQAFLKFVPNPDKLL